MNRQTLFTKPKNVSYTQMSIWLDENFYKEDCDDTKAYTYLWLLAYMLACKHKYFSNVKDYEGFASYVANDTFTRMRCKEKSRVKSGLNYIKSVLYFRKVAYEKERHQEVINPEFDLNWDADNYSRQQKLKLEKTNREITKIIIEDIFATIPLLIKKHIPNVFKFNKVLYNNLYTSCLLSMSARLTLTNMHKKNKEMRFNSTRVFNEVVYYANHLDNLECKLWHLPKAIENVIIIVLNKTMNELKLMIQDTIISSYISDEEFMNISNSAYIERDLYE